MVSTNDMLIGSVVFVMIYVVVRYWFTRQKPSTIETELQQILTGEEFKVKGRVESRADRAQ